MRRRRPVPLMTRPRVSVVVPCYNYGHFLPQAVASALDQSGVDVDVLIVDDCSTDDSAAVAQRLAAADPRIDVLLHETNQGHIQTYNDGLAKVTGDYVVLLSADDVLTSASLTRAVALMEAEPSVGLVYGRVADFDQTLPSRGSQRTSWSVWSGQEWLGHVCRRGRNIIVNPEAVMRTDLLHELGGYDARHPHAADMLLWMRAAARANVGRVNGPVQAGYRVHTANMHSTVFEGAVTDFRHASLTFDAFFAEHPDAALETAARSHLARETMLVAARQQANAEDSTAAAQLAVELDETYAQLPTWLRYQRRQRRLGAAEARFILLADDLRWRLRWQRWWRYGT